METAKRIRRMPEGQAQRTFQVPIEMLQALKEISERTEASMGSLIRRSIKEFLAREQAEKAKSNR